MTTIFQDSTNPEAIGKPEKSVEAGMKVSWGGKEGVKLEGNLSGSIKDNKSHIDVDLTYRSDGTGDVSATGGLNDERSDGRDDQHSGVDQR